MKFEYIKASEAPDKPEKLTTSASGAFVLGILNGLKSGSVAKITPDEAKTVRGLKTSFGRVAKGNGIRIESWSVGDEQVLYVKKIDGKN